MWGCLWASLQPNSFWRYSRYTIWSHIFFTEAWFDYFIFYIISAVLVHSLLFNRWTASLSVSVFVWENIQQFESNFTDLANNLTQTTLIICLKQTSSLSSRNTEPNSILFKKIQGFYVIKTTLSRIISIPFSSSSSFYYVLLFHCVLRVVSYSSSTFFSFKSVLQEVELCPEGSSFLAVWRALSDPFQNMTTSKSSSLCLPCLSLFKSSFLLDSCDVIFTLLCILGREPHVVIVLFESCSFGSSIHLRLVLDHCM